MPFGTYYSNMISYKGATLKNPPNVICIRKIVLVKWALGQSHHWTCRRPNTQLLDDVTKWKHFPRYWTFVWGIPRSAVNSPHKGQWRGTLIFFICVWINDWVNNREACELRRHRAHYDVIVMFAMLSTGIEVTEMLDRIFKLYLFFDDSVSPLQTRLRH